MLATMLIIHIGGEISRADAHHSVPCEHGDEPDRVADLRAAECERESREPNITGKFWRVVRVGRCARPVGGGHYSGSLRSRHP